MHVPLPQDEQIAEDEQDEQCRQRNGNQNKHRKQTPNQNATLLVYIPQVQSK
jgi:hypothetical protein